MAELTPLERAKQLVEEWDGGVHSLAPLIAAALTAEIEAIKRKICDACRTKV